MIIDTIISSEDLFNRLSKFKSERNWLFRGQGDELWNLLPKAGRSKFVSHYKSGFNEEDVFTSWKRYAVSYLKHFPDNEWDWLTLAQHHGLATRFLDWTKNPLNAAFFAVDGNTSKNAAIFAFQINNSDNLKIEPETNPFSVQKFGVYYPKGLSARVVSQRGMFTISNSPTTPIEEILGDRLHKLVIDKSTTKDIRQTLDLFGISKFSIYQDLEHLSEYLNDYVVNDDLDTFISEEISFNEGSP